MSKKEIENLGTVSTVGTSRPANNNKEGEIVAFRQFFTGESIMHDSA
jgi:hypothetical protein